MNKTKKHIASAAIGFTLLMITPMMLYAQPSSADNATEAISKGVQWLIKHQSENGAFSNPQFPGLSALALWAVAGSDTPSATRAVEKGTTFILSKVQPDGGIYMPIPGRKGGGLSTYNTALCLTALAASGHDGITEVILNARTFLAESQHLENDAFKGGFGYDKSNNRAYADLMNTHFVLESMRKTQAFEDKRPAGQPRADLNWAAALEFAERLQNGPQTDDNRGGFFYSPGDAKAGVVKKKDSKNDSETIILRSYGSITYAGLLALVHCKVDKTDPRILSAIDWASRHWTLEENPGMGDQGLYFFYNVLSRAMSAAGTETLPRTTGESIAWKHELIDKVTSLMHEDGHWVNRNGRFWENDPVLATAYAVLALQHAVGTAK